MGFVCLTPGASELDVCAPASHPWLFLKSVGRNKDLQRLISLRMKGMSPWGLVFCWDNQHEHRHLTSDA